MNAQSLPKRIAVSIPQLFGAVVGFVASLILSSMVFPLPKAITDATPESGILSLANAILFNGVVNGVILLWAAKRSSLKGFALWAQLLVLTFGVQSFQTQIESGYFLSAFPLMRGTFIVYTLMLHGFIASLLFTLAIVLLTGGFRNKPRGAARFTVPADRALKIGAWLAAVYVVLYEVFGYYVAWQSQELRVFYGGPAVLNSIGDQLMITLMAKPEMPFFQYFRGVVWILCLVPLFKGFTGKRTELVVLSMLAFGLLPTAQLMFANPFMPAGIALQHFWEVTFSTGIFGALCAVFLPQNAETNAQRAV